MDGSKYRSKGYAMANAGKKLPYVLLMLLAFAAAALSVVVLHKVRERRAFAELLQERDRQLVSLRIQLHKEKAFNKEIKRKVEELKATTSSLRTQKTDQKTKLRGLETTVTNLKNTQKELESALMEKDSRINLMEEAATNLKKAKKELEASITEKDRHIKQMEEKATKTTNTQKELEAALREKDSRIKQLEEKATNVNNTKSELEAVLREKDSRISQMEAKAKGSNPDQMAALMEILQQKEAELEEIKTRFQGIRMTNQAGVNDKGSTHVQMSNTSATPDIVVTKKSTNSSSAIPIKSEERRSTNTTPVVENSHLKDRSLEEKGSANTTVLGSSLPKDRSLEEKRHVNTTVLGSNLLEHRSLEEKRPANTTAVESIHPKDKTKSAGTAVVVNSPPDDRSLEENKFVTNKDDDGIHGNTDDFDEYLDDIYGESHPKKSGSPQKNKKFLNNNQLDSQGDELDGQLWNSLDQDSDHVRYSKLLEKADSGAAAQTKKSKTDTDGNLETISKKAVERMVGAADVKPNINMAVNSDETKLQNKKQKKKRSNKSKKKKMADTAGTNVGEVDKRRAPDATSISK